MSSTENIQDPVTYANEVAASVDDNLLAVDNSSSSSSSFEPSTLEEVYSQVFPSNNLVFARRPTDRRTRKQKNAEFANLLRSNVPSFAGADDAQIRAALAMAAANVNKPQRTVNTARRNALKAAGLLPQPDPQLAQIRETLARQRNIKNNAISDPNLARFLKNVQGLPYDKPVIYNRIRDEKGAPFFIGDWKTSTPQQLPAGERMKAARLFAEMNGMLGWQPKFDRRFLSIASAAVALNDPEMKKYVYTVYDMDDDLYTPGTLIVTDKAENVISVGGYLMGDATPQQSHAQLKDMLYFGSNPTANSRRMQPKGQYLQSVGINKRNFSKGLAPIKNAIESVLKTLFKVVPPTKIEDNGKVVERPALVGLVVNNQVEAVYSLSSIAYNTVLSNLTNLYMNLFVYATLHYDQAGIGAISTVFKGPLNPEMADLQTQVYSTWRTSYVDERITSFVLRDPFINRELNSRALEFNVNNPGFKPPMVNGVMKAIPCLLNVVMMCMMNTHITSEIKSLYTLNKRTAAVGNFINKKPQYVFGSEVLPPENYGMVARTYSELASKAASGTPTMASTPIAWKTVKTMFDVKIQGAQHIEGDNALTRDQLYQNFLPTQ